MTKLEKLEQYLDLVSVLAKKQLGQDITKGVSRTYPVEAFNEDLDEALSQMGVDYAVLYDVRDYANQCASNGQQRALHVAIAEVCQKVIDEYVPANPTFLDVKHA